MCSDVPQGVDLCRTYLSKAFLLKFYCLLIEYFNLLLEVYFKYQASFSVVMLTNENRNSWHHIIACTTSKKVTHQVLLFNPTPASLNIRYDNKDKQKINNASKASPVTLWTWEILKATLTDKYLPGRPVTWLSLPTRYTASSLLPQ